MKIAIILLGNLLTFQIITAQKARLKLSAGYHFSSASQYFTSEIENSNGSYSYKKVDASLGRGLEIRGGIDHLLKPWLGISIDAVYKKTIPSVKGSGKINNFADYSYSEKNKWSSQLIEISPSVLLKVPGLKINPYSSFGLLFPIYSKIKVTGNYQSISIGGGSTGENAKIFRLKNTLGYSASIGVAPELNKKISFFAEVALLSQSIQVKKSTLTSDKVNGVERINTYIISQIEVIYIKKSDNQSYNPDAPRREPGFSLPYSSIGINAGLSIKL